MPNIRGAAPNVMANNIPNSMPNAMNPMNSANMNMNMGLYTKTKVTSSASFGIHKYFH